MSRSSPSAAPAQSSSHARARPGDASDRNRESLAVVLIGGLLISFMARKAFSAYFFGENFIYLQQYQNHGGNFWAAFFSPFGGIFFRPVVFACDLPWHFLLPVEPIAFHLRNFGLIVLELFLLHRILCRVTALPSARIFGCIFFALSKIPLTLIGYINAIDSLVLSLLLLLTALFFLRFAQERKRSDYLLGLLFCLLSHFSKDYGLVVNAVVVAIVLSYGIDWQNRSRELRWWAWRLLPLGFFTMGYFCVRIFVLGSLFQGATESTIGYAPRFTLVESLGKVVRFAMTLCNASWVKDDSSGLAPLIATHLPHFSIASITLGLGLLCGLAMGAFFWQGRKAGIKLIFPLIWSAAYLGPTLLVQGANIYYHWEPMIGFAVLLALLADAAGRQFTKVVGLPLLILIGIGGYLSNQSPNYPWCTITDKTKMIGLVVDKYHQAPLSSITFLAQAQQIQFWNYALADPMLQQLTNKPDLKIHYVPYADIGYRRVTADPTNLVLDTEQGFAPLPADALAAFRVSDKIGPPVMISVSPKSTSAGRPFNTQPNGLAAISIECSSASPKSILLWNGTPLATAYGNSVWLTALVPKELYTTPGTYEIAIATEGVISNSVPFLVRP